MSEIFLKVFVTILPVVILMIYIFGKKQYSPEPTSQLLRAFFMGVCAYLLSVVFAGILMLFRQIPLSPVDFSNSLVYVFFGAAIPKEMAKFVMLWMVLRRNKFFDEYIDGIIYAICIGLGFAAIENLICLFTAPADWIEKDLCGALFLVPSHFLFAIFMGYYYSLGYWRGRLRFYYSSMFTPIILHALYMMCILYLPPVGNTMLLLALILSCIILCGLLHRYASRRIVRVVNLNMKASEAEEV